jgi:hypothetical protein
MEKEKKRAGLGWRKRKEEGAGRGTKSLGNRNYIYFF